MDETVRICPRCGSENYNCKEVVEARAQILVKTVESTRKHNIAMKIVSLVLGSIFTIVGFVFMVLALDEGYMFFMFDGFMCTCGGACAIVFSIIGLARKEFTIVGCWIGLGVSLSSLIMSLPMLAFM